MNKFKFVKGGGNDWGGEGALWAKGHVHHDGGVIEESCGWEGKGGGSGDGNLKGYVKKDLVGNSLSGR